jgi:hypothetical protein
MQQSQVQTTLDAFDPDGSAPATNADTEMAQSGQAPES